MGKKKENTNEYDPVISFKCVSIQFLKSIVPKLVIYTFKAYVNIDGGKAKKDVTIILSKLRVLLNLIK